MIVRAAHQITAFSVILLLFTGTAIAADPVTTLPGHSQRLQTNDNALGLTAGYGGASGFAYRRYLGNSFVQINILPLVADRGDFLALMFGASVGRYLIVWNRPRAASLVPTTTALRAVGTVATYFTRDVNGGNEAPVATGIGVNKGSSTSTADRSKIENTTTIAAGVGFEFGAVLRNGFSMSIDVLLTSAWDEVGFLRLVPLPYASVMYSW